ncbi:MAG: glycogen debranching enzyme N-terminal domain-containing protein, partial [Anaerohalosphaera sp.]|nr:glycogen debranching enzyme N-terminal domain-containing protein [Anaerohalosphaera sp.]
MLIVRSNAGSVIDIIPCSGKGIDELINREWLLTNSRGGFSCGTIAGCNTRRYHGLLTGTANPPANRTLGLSTCMETVTIHGKACDINTLEFEGCFAPEGHKFLNGFDKDVGVHFDYDLGQAWLRKSIYLMPDADGVAVVYDFHDVKCEMDIAVRPFVGMRDFHAMQKINDDISSELHDGGICVKRAGDETNELFIHSDNMWFEGDGQWWYNFLYRKERQRQQECFEDLWSPGVFKSHIDGPSRVVLWASMCRQGEVPPTADMDIDVLLDNLVLRENDWTRNAGSDETLKRLFAAAGQFVVERQIEGKSSYTILAGYPWFLDWGRDTFISLDGLLLCTGRFDEAASVLTTFAGAVSEGMIPNRFDDYGGEAHYNSIDASMWFVHAAFEYLRKSNDKQTFSEVLLPACREIMERYRSGTRFGIHADNDGLITGGDKETQLTWMDAKCSGTAFTPRYGKAVEVNALWYSNLCNLAEYYRDSDDEQSGYFGKLAEVAGESFCRVFWNEDIGYLNDCVRPDGEIDTSMRPNQIYAVSLPFTPLSRGQQKCVVGVVERELLTAHGLRTLNAGDRRYIGKY